MQQDRKSQNKCLVEKDIEVTPRPLFRVLRLHQDPYLMSDTAWKGHHHHRSCGEVLIMF